MGNLIETSSGGKPTLEFALRPHAVPRSVLVERYRPVMMMVRQILGVVPHAMSYLEIYPPAFTSYSVLVPSFLDIPRCDLGRGIEPDLRSLVLYVASRSYGCSYCAAHAAGVGTVFRGSGGSLERNKEALNAEKCELFDRGDIAAINYATAVAKVPAEVRLSHRVELAKYFSEEQEESIALAATAMGFLNCAMDSLGMVLEWNVIENARKYLEPSAWTPNQNYVPEFDDELVEADKLTDDGETLGPLALARTMAGIIAYDRGALSAIPGRPAKIYDQIRELMGFVPYYFERIQRVSTKRVLAHFMVEQIHASGGKAPVWLRNAMNFVAAKQANNNILAAHFAFGAVRAGATVKRLVEAMEPSDELGREQAAFNFARVAALAPAEVSRNEVDQLTKFWQPEGIIELVVTLSIHGLLNRYTSTYPRDTYEPELEAFVAEHGEALGLPPMPHAEGSRWDEAAAKVRLTGTR